MVVALADYSGRKSVFVLTLGIKWGLIVFIVRAVLAAKRQS